MANFKKLLNYRLKETEDTSKKWPLVERLEHWWLERVWEFHQRSTIMRLWWKFAHRFIPRHQYNKIRIRDLEPGYYDPCTRLRHAMFQELCDYLDGTDGVIDWNHKIEVYQALDSVRQYWRVERPKLVQAEEQALTTWHSTRFGPDGDWISRLNAPATEEENRLLRLHIEAELKIDEEDKKHLHIIIDHLPQLWYP